MNQQRAFRAAAWLATLTIISLPIIAALNGWLASDRWPFRRLSVHGEFRRVSLEQVRGAAAPELRTGYFAVDLERVRASVASLPWVERVEVRKQWPDQIDLSIIEREAVASWGAGQLLSTQGELFDVPANTLPEGLPTLVGPDDQRHRVWAFYRNAQRTLQPVALVPSGVVLSERGAWRLPLASGGEILLGRTQAESRLARFAAVYSELSAADPSRLQRADLRYANGFALVWLPAAPEPALPAAEDAPPAEPVPTDPSAESAHT